MVPYLDSRDPGHKKTARRGSGEPPVQLRGGKEPDAVAPVGDEGETAPGLSCNAEAMRGTENRREEVLSEN